MKGVISQGLLFLRRSHRCTRCRHAVASEDGPAAGNTGHDFTLRAPRIEGH
jgi:hypothetical protein